MAKQKVYVVEEDWIHDGEGGYVTHLYSTYEIAKREFDRLVENDKEHGLSSDYLNDVDIVEDVWTEDDSDSDKYYVIEYHDSPNESNGQRYLHSWGFSEKGCYYEFHSDYRLRVQYIDEDIDMPIY